MFYKFIILAFIFSSGCILGWTLELFYRRFKFTNKEHIWVNPGFLTGPYLPLYGFGLTMLYLLAGLEDYIPIQETYLRQGVLFLAMSVVMTLIELIAGEIFIIRMNLKLWDYSQNRFNYKGVICLRFSIYWTLLGAVYYFLIHPHILNALEWFAHNLLFSFFIGIFYGVFFIDLAETFQMVGRIKKFAKENEMIIRYEELKNQIKLYAMEKSENYRFLHALYTEETSLPEHLKRYFEIQAAFLEDDLKNDFIDDKIDKVKEKIERLKEKI